MIRVIIDILLVLGLFFTFVGALGVFGLPDIFSRLQASTCSATMGTVCFIAASIVYVCSHGFEVGACVKMVLLLLLVLCTNPISNHALMKAVCRMGIKPAKVMVMDDYKEDDPE